MITPIHSLKKKKAFALLMSLFLMGFLVLLVITLAAIVQMELKSSRQTLLDQKAKNAAKFAAFQAIAEVQKALGPDQRITANAKILDTELNEIFDDLEEDDSYAFWSYDPMFERDEVNSIEGISNPHWLGVWDSTPGMHPVARDSQESRYDYSERVLAYATNFLVSGNRSIKREDIYPDDELDLSYSPVDELSDDYINMLRKNSIVDENGDYDTDTMQVRVPLVTLPKTDEESSRSYLETRIAWWVSDESQKAPVNVLATEEEFSQMEDDDDKKTLMQAMPFKNGMQALTLPNSDVGIFDIDLNDEEDRDSLRALNEMSQLDSLVDTSATTVSMAKYLYNSVTMNTKGLAVNVRNGGLKKDLSVGLLARNPDQVDSNPNYFERPMGVEGYDSYLTNPISTDGSKEVNIFTANSLYTNNKGHMFGPQAVNNLDLTYIGLNYVRNAAASDDISTVHKDPGGPLWDSLREYYNNRVDRDGLDINANGNTSGYANKLKVKTDVTTGLSPVLLHYQLFVYPTLSHYSGSQYGVRIYYIPIVVLWNPYDIAIAEGSTYAFRHGRAGMDLIGSLRVAVGVHNSSTNSFDAIRDIRAETMPRPSPNVSDDAVTYSTGTDTYDSSVDINAYRAFCFSTEARGMISQTSTGINNGNCNYTGAVAAATALTLDMKVINKAYLGYGQWNYEDTREYVSDVENPSNNSYFPTGLSSLMDIRGSGIVRIYEKVENASITKAVGTSETVTLPTYYYLSSDSFYYRKLYLNNLQYSLAYAPQATLQTGGSLSTYTEDIGRTRLFAGNGDEAVRFLVKNEEPLEAGEAKIFTLKESVPYSYYFDSGDGYAGNFSKAVEKGWYLTEGVDTDSIGGLFIDIMHPERTHLASAFESGQSYGTAIAQSYTAASHRNIVSDPLTECRFDGMALGVLFDTSNNLSYSDDNGTAEGISVSDICIDVCRWNVNPTGSNYTHRLFMSPRGYLKAEAAFNPNPWKSTTSTVPDGSDGINVSRGDFYNYSKAYPTGLDFADLVMWDYADDGDDTAMPLYYYETAVAPDKTDNNYGGATMQWQSLKRYTLKRHDNTNATNKTSFPEPLRITDDYTNSAWKAYFSLSAGMSAFYGGTYGTTVVNSTTNAKEHPGYVEQYLFKANTLGIFSGNININYSRSASQESILSGDFYGIRDKVRGKNFPVYYSYSDGTIYDEYYKNLMIYANSQFTDDANKYSLDDDGLASFMSDLGLDTIYNNHSWVFEDPYFLLRNPRRVAYPRWNLEPSTESGTTALWRDNVPLSFNVQSTQIVEATSTDGLSLDAITANNGRSLVMCEGVTAYRPVSEELAADYDGQEDGEYFFQYQFKFPWLLHYNPTAKVYGDGVFANGGALREQSYGTNDTRGGAATGVRAWAWWAWGNNFQHYAYQLGGEEDKQGNWKMDKWFSFFINKYGSDQVQVGPDVLSEDAYKYTLRHYLRDYETVSSVVDLATADLAFGVDQNRTYGFGLATPDMHYPSNMIGSSFAPLRNAPERPYDYSWADSFSTVAAENSKTGDGERSDAEIRHVTYDMSWNLNDLLWDEYFFSTIPYREGEQNDMDDYYDYLIPKNPRIRYINTAKDKLYVRVDINDDTNIDMVDNKISLSGKSISSYLNDSMALDYDFDINSTRFWINGPFNVNSTNVDAWKMVLATSFGNDIYGFSDESDAETKTYSDKAPFPRNGMPYLAKEFDATSNSNKVRGVEKDLMQGFRALSRDELEELAMSMVENIKDRGPFYSLADFVNRSVELRSGEMRRMGTSSGNYTYDYSNDIWAEPHNSSAEIKVNRDEGIANNFYLRQDHMQKGVMQSAIDLTSINTAFFEDAYLIDLGDDFSAETSTVGLNAKFTSLVDKKDMGSWHLTGLNSYYYSTTAQETFWKNFGNPRNLWENYRAGLGSTLAGAPTYLTQADILKQIGSFITVRGDTFKIRAYGEIRNPLTEEVESKAWCEVLVQRYPEYMDSSLNLSTDVNNREAELGYQSARDDYDSLLEQLEVNPVNKYLGRRFKVVSFKWLSEREI